MLYGKLLQAQLESATRQAREYEQAAVDAEARVREASRQLLDAQHKCDELAKKCEELERAKQQVQQQITAAEVRAETE